MLVETCNIYHLLVICMVVAHAVVHIGKITVENKQLEKHVLSMSHGAGADAGFVKRGGRVSKFVKRGG